MTHSPLSRRQNKGQLLCDFAWKGERGASVKLKPRRWTRRRGLRWKLALLAFAKTAGSHVVMQLPFMYGRSCLGHHLITTKWLGRKLVGEQRACLFAHLSSSFCAEGRKGFLLRESLFIHHLRVKYLLLHKVLKWPPPTLFLKIMAHQHCFSARIIHLRCNGVNLALRRVCLAIYSLTHVHTECVEEFWMWLH